MQQSKTIQKTAAGAMIFGLLISFAVFIALKHWQETARFHEFEYKAIGHTAAIQVEFKHIEKIIREVQALISYRVNTDHINSHDVDALMPIAKNLLIHEPDLSNMAWAVAATDTMQSGKPSRFKLLYVHNGRLNNADNDDFKVGNYYSDHLKHAAPTASKCTEHQQVFIEHERHPEGNEITFTAPVYRQIQNDSQIGCVQTGLLIVEWNVVGLIEQALKNVPVSGQDILFYTINQQNIRTQFYTHVSRSRKPSEQITSSYLHLSTRPDIAGLQWQMEFNAAPQFLRDFPIVLAWPSLFLCLLITVIVVRIVYRSGQQLSMHKEHAQRSRIKYHNLIADSPEAHCIHRDGKWIFHNEAALKLFDASSPEDMLGKPVLDFIHPDFHSELQSQMDHASEHDQTKNGLPINQQDLPLSEIRLLTCAGKAFDAALLETHIDYNDRPAGMFIVRDISQRKQLEQQLIKLSRAVEQSGESIVITDRHGIVDYINPAFTLMTGYSQEETIGIPMQNLHRNAQDIEIYQSMRKSILDGQIWQGDVVNQRKDGSAYPAKLTVSPITDASGDITHFVGIEFDLSHQENLERQFYQSQKMHEIGTLVGGIAHDFNNILAGILGNIYLAKQNVISLPKVENRLSMIEKSANIGADMIAQLLTFARKGQVKKEVLSLSPFVKEHITALAAWMPENITIKQNICTTTLSIRGDTTQLTQVLMNLVNNARDAVKGVDAPKITVSLEAFHTDEVFLDRHPYFKAGDYAHLSVEDNGCGIPANQKESIFQPFFTTKDVGKGTGLGLSMVIGSIKTHHGFIEVDSIQGKGSTFHIFLPLHTQPHEAIAITQEEPISSGMGEWILVADDEKSLCKITAEALEHSGYYSITANDGIEALALFKAHQNDISIAMLDMLMPHINGIKLAEQIRSIQPDLPIIFVTGYDKEQALNGDKLMKNSILLTKPVNFKKLNLHLRKILHNQVS